MTATQETVKNIINSSAKILLVREPSADEATILAMLALKNILGEAGKKIFLSPAPSENFAEKFGKIAPREQAAEMPQKIKIKIPKNSPIEELRYEEDENFFSVLISPKNKMEPAELLIEKSPLDFDAAFCFFAGMDGWKKINAPIARPAPEKTVYVARDEKTAAEKINEIHAILNGPAPLPRVTATLLMASLVFETDNFQKQSRAVFALANIFLDAGADQKTVEEITLADKKIELAQITGRALARTTIEPNLKTSWTFLTRRDFEKTGVAALKENMLFLLRKVRSNIAPPPCSIVCFENGDEVQSLIYHEDKNVLANLAMSLGGEPESLYFFASGFKNFSEAETKIRQLLKRSS